MITIEDVKNNPEVQELILGAQKQLDVLGYTEHSFRHIEIVSHRAGQILQELKYDERIIPCIKECRSATQVSNLMAACRNGRFLEYYERIIAYKKENPESRYKVKVSYNDKIDEVTIKISPELIDTDYR